MSEKKSTINYYVKNKDLLVEIRALKETNKFSEKLGGYVMKIVDGLSHRPNFHGYTYIDEMRSEAHVAIVRGLKNFDPDKYDNPFSYITQIAWNAFIAFINKEKSKSKVKNRLFDLKDEIEEDNPFEKLKAIDYSKMCQIVLTTDVVPPIEESLEIEDDEYEKED